MMATLNKAEGTNKAVDESAKSEELKVQCAAALKEAIEHKHEIESRYKSKLEELKAQCAAALKEANSHYKSIMDAFKREYASEIRAVEGGDEIAKTKLAWLKLSGLGGAEKDEDGAVALLEERVKEGDDEAMWMLGVCNEYGIGTEQDIERAEDLYKQSHERGNKIGKFFAAYEDDERGSGNMGMNRL